MIGEKDKSEDDMNLVDELDDNPGHQYITNRVLLTNEGLLDPSQLVRTEGYMNKKGGAVNARGGFRNWKKRWFVLAPVEFLGHPAYELQYFDTPNGSMKGKVSLNEVDLFMETKTHKNRMKVKHEFQLLLQNGGVLELSCETEEEREEWLTTLGIVIGYLRKVTTTGAVMTLNGYDPLCEDDEESFQIGEEIAKNCQAYGPGLFGAEAGKATSFAVQIHDLLGQKVAIGGMPVTATLEREDEDDENELPALYYIKMEDNNDGTYTANYTLGRAGKYQLSIALNEEHQIFGSPFEIEVLPSKTVASYCYATGDSLIRMPLKAVSTFTIIAVDSFGNRKRRGGDPFEVGIMGPAQLIQLKDNDDGSYTVVVEVLGAPAVSNFQSSLNSNSNNSNLGMSTIMILITLYGKPIAGSPYKPSLVEQSTLVKETGLGGLATIGGKKPHSNGLSPSSVKDASVTKKPGDRGGLASSAATVSSVNTGNTARQPQATAINNKQAPSSATKQAVQKAPIQPPIKPPTAPLAQPVAAAQPPPAPPVPDNPNLSRLERSRQKALMAKMNQGNNPTSATEVSSTTVNNQPFTQPNKVGIQVGTGPSTNRGRLPPPPVPAEIADDRDDYSATFGLPMHLLKDDYNPGNTTESGLGTSQIKDKGAAVSLGTEILRTSKLSQLAHKNIGMPNSQNPASAMNTTSMGDTSGGLGQGKTRSNFLNDLAANLRQGLGKMNTSLNSSSTPQEIELWETTHASCMDDKIIEKVLTHAETLFQLFSLFADRVEGVSVVKLITTKGHGGIYRLLELYEIMPNYLSKAETKILFNRILLSQRALKLPASLAGGGNGLEFSAFIRLCTMIAIFALSKSDLLANHYNTVEAKLDVMFFKWGLVDNNRLQYIRKQLANSPDALS